MKTLGLLLYLAMAVWLLVSAALRLAIQLNAGTDLDVIPFISLGLGLVALIAFVAARDEARELRQNPEPPADR